MNWQVYIILCSDNSLYTGITTDIERRFRQHHEGRGARYFLGRWPIEVVYLERGHNQSSASKRNYDKNDEKRRKETLDIIRNK